MRAARITIVSSSLGDWEGLYRDGHLLDEGHSLRLDKILELLGFEVEEKEAAQDWLENEGSLPQDLEKVKFQ